jgi:hypothetical protein
MMLHAVVGVRRTLAVVTAVALLLLGLAAVARAGSSGLVFDGNFENGITPWKTGGGGAQCANYGTPSNSPRLRGDFYLSTMAGQGNYSGQFTLPADTNTSTYPLEACDLVTANQVNVMPQVLYYGLMIYVPRGWTIANTGFWGVEIWELHFVGVYGAPVALQLHADHLTLALETGQCTASSQLTGGQAGACQYRSNADNHACVSSSSVTCEPGYYVIPPGQLVQGQWNEIVLGVRWASDSTGQIQTWYRPASSSTWRQGSSMSGYPTEQWEQPTLLGGGGCCASTYVDELEAYTDALSAPLSLWLDNAVVGTSFSAVDATMPIIVPPNGGGGGGGGGSGGGGTGGGGSGSGGGSGGPVVPVLSALRITPRTFGLTGRRVRGRCVSARATRGRGPRCTLGVRLRVRYRLNEAATVTVTLRQRLSGRRVNGRCVSAAHGLTLRPACQLLVTIPRIWVLSARRGSDALWFTGLGGRRRLAPGRYVLVLVPVVAGRPGRPQTITFTIRR